MIKGIQDMYFEKIRESNIDKIMASLDDQKTSLEPCLHPIFSYKSVSYDLENRSKCCLKTLKNGQNWADNGPENPENGIRKWLDTPRNKEQGNCFS